MGKYPPAFQFYPADFDSGTSHLTNELVGIYIRLLNHQWVNGSVPADFKDMGVIVRLSPKKTEKLFKKLSQKFTKKTGIYINERMEEVRKEQLEYREKQTLAGKAGAAARWNRDGNRNAIAPESQCPNDGSSPSPSVKSNLTVTCQPPADDCPHNEIINLYHELLPMLPRVGMIGSNGKKKYDWKGQRRTNLQTRWREDESRQNLDWWAELFKYILDSNHLTGKSGGWKASLGWIVKYANWTKIKEGNYHG